MKAISERGPHRPACRLLLAAGWAAAMLGLAPPAAAAAGEPVTILAFGDSLISGFGLAEADGIPAQLQRRLADDGIAAEVVNGGVAGDTSAGGLARLDWTLGEGTRIVVLEFGANDGLRGLDPAATEANLDAMLTELRSRKIAVLLSGMRAPRNLGPDYATAFDAIYPRLAAKHGVTLDPFFLAGVALDPDLNQPDGFHPNAAGAAVIARRLAPVLERMIAGLGAVGG
jgi:acyl-CoA thioesterase-1